ncbi:Adenosylmethionine-8-amino-7-oxononanoate aminotransferase [invertebrate metagenome]|uniref:Adenosylmethionine-8-amino-7-oxononanoate aminotransferase n=1 Tax=invertebrate metagenome TaxID=1711999 RepID=A0A484HCF8_9ZZZZ
MDRLQALVSHDRRHIWHPFTQDYDTAPLPVIIRSASGAVLYGEDGQEYIDMISSWWVTLHGHTHPAIVRAIGEQAAKLEQVIFAGFTHEGAIELAHRLASILPEDLNRVFFSDNGSTAVEVALKIAHQYWRNVGAPERRRLLACEGGYHGDTVGAMSVGVQSGFFGHFTDMMFEIVTLPFPFTWNGDSSVKEREFTCLTALDTWLERFGHETAALIIEPLIQGAGGMRMCRPQFLHGIAARCRAAGVLLIFDEVMTGFGRTGRPFATLTAQVTPDIICLAKGLTGGFLPMSVTVCRDSIYQAFLGESFDRALAHGHSFTANPLACAAALASLHLLMSSQTEAALQTIEHHHRARLQRLAKHPRVKQPRVTGTVAAFNVAGQDSGYGAKVGQQVRNFCMARGLLLRPLGNVVYLLPPYCITPAQLNKAYDLIEESLSDMPTFSPINL